MKLSRRTIHFFLVASAGFAMWSQAACNVVLAEENALATPMAIEKKPFGNTTDGKAVTLFQLTNDAGNVVELIDYGAIVVSIQVPDKNGKKTNVTAGFSSIDGYLQRHPYFGATVGRFCNRIAKGKFTLEGKTYSLATNNGPNHLHGGEIGFDKRMWQVAEVK
jgi:aldose 1-epimerase